jgi:hypothetical protein
MKASWFIFLSWILRQSKQTLSASSYSQLPLLLYRPYISSPDSPVCSHRTGGCPAVFSDRVRDCPSGCSDRARDCPGGCSDRPRDCPGGCSDRPRDRPPVCSDRTSNFPSGHRPHHAQPRTCSNDPRICTNEIPRSQPAESRTGVSNPRVESAFRSLTRCADDHHSCATRDRLGEP